MTWGLTELILFISDRAAVLKLKLPEVECEDGSLALPFILRFEEDGAVFDTYNIEPNYSTDHKATIALKLK